MANLRMGVVGVGHLGQHHARVVAGLGGVDLVGVADARPEQARAVAARHGTTAFDDWREMLDRVDAVSVAVPTALHREVAGAFLGRGVSTLVEKPIASTVAQAEELVELARAAGAVLQVGHIERFNPALAALDGLNLQPKFIDAERLSTYTFRSSDIGVVLDLMIHDIDLILSMVNSPVAAVSAVGISVFGPHEDIANAYLTFEDGTVANLTASRASYNASRKMRLYGPEGYAAVDFAARSATLLRPSPALRRGDLEIDGLDLSQPAAVKERIFGTMLVPEHVQAAGREPLALELEDFVDAIRTRTWPVVTGADALRAMRLADTILRSLDTHAWENRPKGPIGPRGYREAPEPSSALPRPKLWGPRPVRSAS